MPHHHDDPTVVALTGAGISTGAGIPDFRGPAGTWTAHPEQARLLEIGVFLHDQEARIEGWRQWRDHPAWHARPSVAHRALVELERAGVLGTTLTQNFDGLHQAAGARDVVELHGGLRRTSCVRCGHSVPTSAVLARLDEEPDPRCERCGGILKPDVVYFGQLLDDEAFGRAVAAAQDAEVFVAIGTTLSVNPVAELAGLAVRHGARLIVVNAQPTPYDHLADRLLREPIDEAVPQLVDDLISLWS